MTGPRIVLVDDHALCRNGLTDLLTHRGGMEVLDAARSRSPDTQTLMITAYATTEQAVEAMRKGAYDYVQKPFRNH